MRERVWACDYSHTGLIPNPQYSSSGNKMVVTHDNVNYKYRTGRSLGRGGGKSSLALSGTLLLDPSFSYPQAVEIWCDEREGRELVIKLH